MTRVRLTPRLLSIGELAARGLTNQEIAERLLLAYQTVKNRMRDLFRVLGVRNRVELALAFKKVGRAREGRSHGRQWRKSARHQA